MAIDIIARGLASSIVGSDGKIASDKRPVMPDVGTSGFTPIGNLTDGTQVAGKTAEELLLMILYGVVSPTLTNPSFIAEVISGATAIVGANNEVVIRLSFDRGAITPANGTSGYRTGPRENFTVGANEVVADTDVYEYTLAFTPTIAGDETIQCSVSYQAGEQPLDSLGQPYSTPLSAGQLSSSVEVKSIYQLYLADKSVADYSYEILDDGECYVLNSASEGSGTKQSFAIAENISVIGIKQFEPMTQQWMWIGGDEEASLETFDTTILEGETLGQSVNYVCYTHKGSDIGARQLRIYVAQV